MRWLSDNVLAKLQSGLGAPLESDPETEVDLHLKGQVFGDRFAIDHWLGSGGMGTVYRAVDQETGEQAVVKLIHPSFVGRDGKGAALAVLKEATALGAVEKGKTPHVVRLLGTGTIVADVLAGETLELPWIAVEFVDGGAEGTNLEERVGYAVRSLGHAFPPARAARAVEQIGLGLEAVHAAHVVHRDVKPANVLCAGAGDAETFKLADFGVSRPLGVSGTFGGLLVGTPGYAPPELMAIAEPLDRRVRVRVARLLPAGGRPLLPADEHPRQPGRRPQAGAAEP
ncbi:MAG TPA: protein kinase, partial [Minicystis sp.]|nr:protein kinase [Minicystis sp.]